MKLTVQNISKIYTSRDKNQNKLNALNDVSFTVNSGEFCAIVGESGSGKSTLSQIITGLIPATSGKVFFNDVELACSNSKKQKELFRKVQLVLQDGKSALDPHFSIYNCIAEPIRNLCRMSRNDEKNRVSELIRQMELSEDILQRKPHELSGGQQKRVCIARALAVDPEIIIFDEAISGLDVILRKSILDLLKRIHKENGCTMLFITHDMDVALYMASRIIVMKDGRIVEDTACSGKPGCLTHPYSKMLAAAMLPEIGNNADA
ncbi:MAG: ABC transporter ATP-binding protein [Ruminococcus sp.]|nr:ABC transporter ATP-binding protein [Ruminococcus sp.]